MGFKLSANGNAETGAELVPLKENLAAANSELHAPDASVVLIDLQTIKNWGAVFLSRS